MSSSSKRTEKQNRFELKTLLETSRLLIESHETDFVLNNLLLITMGKMQVHRGAILIHQSETDDYVVTKIKGRSTVEEGTRIELPWHPDDYESIVIDPLELNQQIPELFEGKNRGLFFNLRTSNHHLGYLYLSRKGDGKVLDSREIEFVESLSIISSVAISNSRMFSQMRQIHRKLDRKVYELNTLFDLSKEFNSLADRDKIASTFKFALLGQLLTKKFFLLYRINETPKLLASSGLKETPLRNVRSKIFNLPDDILHVNQDHYEEVPFLKENEIAVLVALQMQGEKTAVVGVSQKANNEPLTQSDLNFLQSLGNLAVLSIQKTLFLKERIEKERLDEEINIAKKIQKGLFPGFIPKIRDLDLAAKNIPSQHVGGDYFDIVESPDTNYILAIGDVTGKGIPAALLMANLQSMLHVLLPVEISLKEATGRINNLIYENTPSDIFITFFWGKYFHKDKTFRYINAGHNPPLLLRRDSDHFQNLEEGGLILGAWPTTTPYKESEIKLQPGDILIAYTDGVTEAFSKNGAIYEEERLQSVILNNRDQKASKLIDIIVEDVRKFTDNRLTDDITLVIVKVI